MHYFILNNTLQYSSLAFKDSDYILENHFLLKITPHHLEVLDYYHRALYSTHPRTRPCYSTDVICPNITLTSYKPITSTEEP